MKMKQQIFNQSQINSSVLDAYFMLNGTWNQI